MEMGYAIHKQRLICWQSASNLMTQTLALTAPYWNNAYNQLNFKFIQADEFGNDFGGCATSVDCIPNSSYIEPVQVSVGPITVGTNTFSIDANQLTSFDPQTDTIYSEWIEDNPQIAYCDANYWKPTKSTVRATLSPNPAKDKISITIEGIAETINIELIDIYGRIIANLYDGEILKLHQPLLLPQINSGLYFAKIKVDNKLLPVQKIIIY